MAEVDTSWAVAPGTNLVGIARLKQTAGECVDFSCGSRITIHLVMEGHYEVTDGREKLVIGPGDLYFIRHPETDMDACFETVIRVASPRATVICGSFSASTTALHMSVRILPPTLHISAAQIGTEPQLSGILSLLRDEIGNDACGRELLSNHLFEALFLSVIRSWYRRFPDTSCLLNALGDPYLARAIGRLHEAPHYPWTVGELAVVAGLSRAAFARRFRHGTGDTPLGYLTRWRMNMAAEMLDQAMDIRHICTKVGYISEFAFSRAFSRHHGMSPTRYRDRRNAVA